MSYDRVLSGSGLENVYQFVREQAAGEEPIWLGVDMQRHAAEAAASLKMLATGALYVGGGIAPRIVAKLSNGTSKEAFVAEGCIRPLLEAILVRVERTYRSPRCGTRGGPACVRHDPHPAPDAPMTQRR